MGRYATIIISWLLILLFVFLVGKTIYATWFDYENPYYLLHLPNDIRYNTSWVNDSTTLYYIDDRVLRSIKVNGQNPQVIITTPFPIKEYAFSPDGEKILVNTGRSLHLVFLEKGEKRLVDQITDEEVQKDVKGSLYGFSWAPDSQKCIYRKSLWSNVGSRDTAYVYFLTVDKKRDIVNPVRKLSHIYWTKDASEFVYLDTKTNEVDLTYQERRFNVFKVNLISMKPAYYATFVSGAPTYQKKQVKVL